MQRIRFLNPRSDLGFVQTVERILADGVSDPGVFQARLREEHPSAVVREMDLSGASEPVWYAYRDGGWVPD